MYMHGLAKENLRICRHDTERAEWGARLPNNVNSAPANVATMAPHPDTSAFGE